MAPETRPVEAHARELWTSHARRPRLRHQRVRHRVRDAARGAGERDEALLKALGKTP
jgi:hypothetical protein